MAGAGAGPMTESEYQELFDAARAYCEALASYRTYMKSSKKEPQPRIIQRKRQRLNALSVRLDRLKSSNELDQVRARRRSPRIIFETGVAWKKAQ